MFSLATQEASSLRALVMVVREVQISDARRYSRVDAPSLAAIVRRDLEETGITCEHAALAVAGSL